MADIRVIPWNKFFEIKKNEMVTYQIIPRSGLVNGTNQKMWRLLHKMYEVNASLKSRITLDRENKKVYVREKDLIFYDIVYRENQVQFFLSTTSIWHKKIKDTFENKLKVQMKEVDRKELEVPEGADIYELRYRDHDIFSQNTDGNDQSTPIATLLSVSEDVEEGDYARLSITSDVFEHDKWLKISTYAKEKVDKGKSIHRARISPKIAGKALSVGVISFMNEVFSLIQDTIQAFENTIFSGYKRDTDKKKENKIIDRPLLFDQKVGKDPSTKKLYDRVYRSRIRVAAYSENDLRKKIIGNSLSNAYGEIGHDNELIPMKVTLRGRKESIRKEMNDLKLSTKSFHDPDVNLVSAREIGKMTNLPTRELQEKYKDVLQVNRNIESIVSAALTKEGLHLGSIETKEGTNQVYFPTKNFDELCLPHVAVGGMGSGKTEGFGAGHMVEMVKKGFGAVGIDPKDYQIRRQLEAGLPEDKIVKIDIGKVPLSLDWREVNHSTNGKNKLANAVLSFFESIVEDGTGPQTARYIRAAVMGMKTGKLSEIIRILEDKEYTKEVIKDMKNEMHINTLNDLVVMGEKNSGKKAQILAPIYNRLDIILGDDFLNECMEANEGIDFVELMSKPQAIIIDVPKAKLDKTQIQLIVSLLTTKIDLAMTLRDEKKRIPFSIVYDEPHQFIKSGKTWKSAVVESRYWRMKYVFMFHSWEQIPRDLAEIIKAAGVNYTLYRSSKKTFEDLKEEIKPITVEEAINLKKYHAINVLYAGGESQTPFVLNMALPPSKQSSRSHEKVTGSHKT